ncbi:MAG: hypothetical protein MUP58_03500 [Candidatus Nanohaloarchaeota archaeon QJJ-9]|nr:hypothetical protein [Candidatus Nanohaloarchaeota archaeon QJJ-9]
MDKILFTRPDHEIVTSYLHKWTEKLVDKADELNRKIFDLEKEKATKENFESYIENRPDLILINGHGNERKACGHKDQPLLINGENEELTEGKIVYARTCNSASVLGKSCVENGAKAFLGYKNRFILLRNTDSTAKPLKDKYASPIMEASNETPKNLIKGKDPEKSMEKSRKKSRKKIEEVLTDYQIGSDKIIGAIRHNMESQVVID